MAAVTDTKPERPYPEFPLFAHGNGQWAKKIKGKQWFFGTWNNHESALDKYLDEVDEIQAGRDPRRTGVVRVSSSELSVYDLCNLFLARQEASVAAGEVSNRHFSDCFKSCRLLTDHFGKFMRAAALRAGDFKELRAGFRTTWGPAKIGSEVQRIRTVFKWGAESELIPAIPNFGPDFRKPSRTVSRRDRQQRQAERGGRLDFSADEIRTLLKASTGWLHACILLGINGGMGNSDCGRLSTTFLDLKSGWYDLARHKTGIPRRFRLWPETTNAIQAAMRRCPIAKNDDDDSLCFLTTHGRPIWWEIKKESGETYVRDNIVTAFKKLVDKCQVNRPEQRVRRVADRLWPNLQRAARTRIVPRELLCDLAAALQKTRRNNMPSDDEQVSSFDGNEASGT